MDVPLQTWSCSCQEARHFCDCQQHLHFHYQVWTFIWCKCGNCFLHQGSKVNENLRILSSGQTNNLFNKVLTTCIWGHIFRLSCSSCSHWYTSDTIPTCRPKQAKGFWNISVKLQKSWWLLAYTKSMTSHSPFYCIKPSKCLVFLVCHTCYHSSPVSCVPFWSLIMFKIISHPIVVFTDLLGSAR
jgi:hypothetical protein